LSDQEVARLALEREHFEIVECADGRQALDVLTERGSDLAAVISDIDMPRMDGISLKSASALRYPGLPFVLMSGAAPRAASSDFHSAPFLAKPFDLQTLLDLVHSITPHPSPEKHYLLSNKC
jgi:DNA-binding NtrC family response regulator